MRASRGIWIGIELSMGVLFLDYSIKFVEWWVAGINAQLWEDDGSWDLGLFM